MSPLHPDTLAIHAGAPAERPGGQVAPPIALTTTWVHGPAAELPHGYEYVREGSPLHTQFEDACAALEGGARALSFASGAAVATALMQAQEPGTHVLLPAECYMQIRELARDHFTRWGLTHTVVDMCDLDAVRAAWTPATRVVWLETPSNPQMSVTDIATIAALARKHGARTIVDNTFATPVLQQPLALGADVVTHSATKYIGGHSDVHGGVAIFARDGDFVRRTLRLRTVTGGVMAPFNVWLALRGLRTLPVRVRRHSEIALALAKWLTTHSRVATVRYPWLPSHPQHALATRQMSGGGGMLSVDVAGTREDAIAVVGRVRLFTPATSLGGVESLIEHRASIEGALSSAPPTLLRLSVGLEHPDDLIADLDQALRGERRLTAGTRARST